MQNQRKKHDSFKSLFKRIDWDLIEQHNSENNACNVLLDLFTKGCDQAFPEID